MKRWVLIVLLAAVVAAVFAVKKMPRVGGQSVVLELFTSQGCSSCPPADALLRRIANDPSLRGRVIPLAYHVDYWNHLGWRDPFSSRAWSQRQYEYVGAMKLNGAYTPQAVINGSRQMVGSSSFEIYRAIEEESRRKTEGSVRVRIEGRHVVVHGRSPRKDVDLIVVAFENGATTNVTHGENNGKSLANDAIVRKLVRVGTFTGKGDI
ncbi:MAG TPA: DUF1223 domain-containing protein [Thermoanaerobaculia bacterium]|nr:DUF1223 domain-containing protein [Thermoanaerobaculia bacterium]